MPYCHEGYQQNPTARIQGMVDQGSFSVLQFKSNKYCCGYYILKEPHVNVSLVKEM